MELGREFLGLGGERQDLRFRIGIFSGLDGLPERVRLGACVDTSRCVRSSGLRLSGGALGTGIPDQMDQRLPLHML